MATEWTPSFWLPAQGAFGLLLWKNFTLLKRRPKGVTAQVLLPCAVVGMLILVRSITEDQKKTKCQR